MAKKKTARKRAASKKVKRKAAARKGALAGSLFKVFTALAILLVFVISAAITARFIITPHRTPSVKKPGVKTGSIQGKESGRVATIVSPPANQPPTYEIYPARDLPSDRPILPDIKRPRPAVSIIIDDMGYKQAISEKFCRLDAALTFSIFPGSPFKTAIIKSANEHGIEIMLHLPMEPNEFPRVNPGPGALLSSMTPDELINQLNQNLDDVPLVKGVNNHMGSRLTSSSFQMNQIFSILKKRGLFFIDSRTTSATVAWQSARLLQVPFSQRDVFLDHVQERAFVKKQILALINTAKRQGGAVGIGHPYAITLEVLEEMLPEIKKQVDIVPASQMVHLIPYS
ncbi:MAG: divergent polysaccharide deacetylase family protein [Desulfobacterales bacterium]|nr:divergent polysaccharide deacetylase family protein [Desulfobacterales bacterium]